jgi:hypothetical protein
MLDEGPLLKGSYCLDTLYDLEKALRIWEKLRKET